MRTLAELGRTQTAEGVGMIALVLVSILSTARGIEPSERERCERNLAAANDARFEQRRAAIRTNDLFLENALRVMKANDELRAPHREAALRAEIRFGQIFAREGLLHEAIYRAFNERFETKAAAMSALRTFRVLEHEDDQASLIAAVTERTLQMVPDFDAEDLPRLARRAEHLNLTVAELQNFRDHWRIYDAEEEFVETLQGAVYSLLVSGDSRVIEGVEARGRFWRRFAGRALAVNPPRRPDARNPTPTARQIAFEDQPYYLTEDIMSYLDQSSVAARRYFVRGGLEKLTSAQLRAISARSLTWGFDVPLTKQITHEIEARRPWLEKTAAADEIRRRLREVERALAKYEARPRYDRTAVQAAIGRLRKSNDTSEIIELAVDVIGRVANEATTAQFTNLILSVRDATLSRIGGRGEPTLRLSELIVVHANELNLDEAQCEKVAGVLHAWADRLSGFERARARDLTARLVRPRATLPPLNLPALALFKRELATASTSLETELNEAARILLNPR